MDSSQPTSTLINGVKTVVPLENNPVVFTQLIRELGGSPALSFHDVYALDAPELLALIPRPALSLIFNCPGAVYSATRAAQGPSIPGDKYDARYFAADASSKDAAGGPPPVLWFPQTIHEACGLMALLHGVLNGAGRAYINPGSPLDQLRQQALQTRPAADRARLIHDSDILERAHAAAARLGDSSAPDLGGTVDGHFVSFVIGDDRHLWQLVGWEGAVDLGELPEGEDVLGEEALRRGVRAFVEKCAGDPKLSIVAMTAGGEEE